MCCVAAGCGKGGKNGAERAESTGDSAVSHGAASGNPSRPIPGGRLVIGMQQEPEILNEAVNSMVADIYVCSLIFSKFVKYNDRLDLVPDLIEEIPTVENGGVSPDYLTYTYECPSCGIKFV